MRARELRAPRRRLRDRHGQLQPGDRLHRLRHLRPAVLRAAHPRGRARGRARRAARRRAGPACSSSSAGRPRWASRSGSRPPACRSSAPARQPSTWPRTAAPSARCWPRPACPRPGTARPAASRRPGRSRTQIGYPVLVRPSYVLGGRGMEVVYDEAGLADYLVRAAGPGSRCRPSSRCSSTASSTTPSRSTSTPSSTATELYLGGVMEHIEEAGIHSGDSACVLPPVTLGAPPDRPPSARRTEAIARGVGVRGLLNVQFALAAGVLYVLEANPRAPAGPRRSSPRRPAVPLAKAAARIMLGATIADLRAEGMLPAEGDGADLPDDAPLAVKEAVLPFKRFRTADRPLRRRPARSRDALHRRGHGHRRGLPRAPSPSRRPPPTAVCRLRRQGVRLGRRPRQARHGLPGQAARRPGLRGAGHRGHGRGAAPQRHHQHGGAQAQQRTGPGRRADDRRSRSTPATSTWSSTPRAGRPRGVDGYEIRAATTSHATSRSSRRCSSSRRRCRRSRPPPAPVRVRSLQEHAHSLGRPVPRAGVVGRRRGPRAGARGEGAGVSALYRRVLLPPVALATRRDAEVAMDAHLRAMRRAAGAPGPAAARRTPARTPAGPAARAGPAGRAALPAPVRRRRRLRQERRRVPRVRGALRARLRRGGHRHPAAAGGQSPPAVHRLPRRRTSSTRWASTTAARRPPAANLLALPAPAGAARGQPRQARRTPRTTRPPRTTPRSSGGSRPW